VSATAVGVAEKEDGERRIDEQDIFHRVVFFLAAITIGLLSRVLGADDAPFGAVMGKRGTLTFLACPPESSFRSPLTPCGIVCYITPIV
jgi:hypothetical protein